MRALILALAAAGTLLSSPLDAVAQVLRVAPPAPVVDYDPHGPNGLLRDTIMANRNIFDPLVEFEGDRPVGRLATSWEQADPLTWRFTLRHGVRFHDGQTMTSADVAASFERMARQRGGLGPLWTAFERAEAPDPQTVVIHLKTPVGPFLRNVSLLQIIPASAVREAGTRYGAAVRPPGTGPFRVRNFRPGQVLELEAHHDYWAGRPQIAGVVLRHIPELAGRVTALINNEIDLTWFVPDDQVPALRANRDLTVSIVPSAIYYYNWFNAGRRPFDDVRVRRALWHAVDVRQVVADLMPVTGRLATAPITSVVYGHSPQPPYAYDPDLARRLLAEAGFPNGFSTELKYSDAQGPELEQMALAFISYWNRVGVRVTPVRQENTVWTRDLRELNWDMTMSTNPSFTEDADYTIGRLYTTRRSGYENAELTGLLLEAQRESDQAQRRELYAEAIRFIWSEAIGIFPADINATYVHRRTVEGVELSPTMTPRFRNVTITRR